MNELIVVTGASGFVGGALVDELVSRGHKVLPVSRRPLRSRHSHLRVPVTDYVQTPCPENAILIHAAENRDLGLAESNVLTAGAIELATALAQKPFSRIAYLSSASVYGDATDVPHHPDGQLAPMGAYASAKYRCEKIMLERGATLIRPSNIYGPGMAENNVLADILRQIPGEGPVAIRDAAPVRDFLWIGDAAAGICALVEQAASGIFNLSTGTGTAAGELARMALELAGQAARRVVETAPAGRFSKLVLNSSATTKACGWLPTVSLQQGLRAMMVAP